MQHTSRSTQLLIFVSVHGIAQHTAKEGETGAHQMSLDEAELSLDRECGTLLSCFLNASSDAVLVGAVDEVGHRYLEQRMIVDILRSTRGQSCTFIHWSLDGPSWPRELIAYGNKGRIWNENHTLSGTKEKKYDSDF